MKKLFTTALFLLISAFIFAAGTVTTSGTGDGFSGKIKVDVVTTGEKIEDIKLVSDSETSHIISRAFPVLKERILKAQSPIVDSVSGASYTSFGIKKAVAEALKSNGKDFGRIRFNTKAPEQPAANLEAVNTDLVIIGGGPAGLAAAISAREAGLKNIILIEKLDILSGNGKYDMNFYDLINSEAQKARGINDTVEALIADNTNPLDTPERIRAQAEGAFVLDKWLRSFGVKLNYNYGKRGHMAESNAYAGAHIQDGMEKKVKELGIDVRTGTKGLDLIMKDGKAAGVKVQNGNNFYDINAKAVIIATGGFSANKELLKKYVPGSEVFQTSNQIGATGDFIPVFEKNNIKTANLEVLNIFPFIIRQTRDLTGGGDGFILVNKDGKRFTSENITYATRFSTAQKILDQPDSAVFYIYDQKLYDASFRLQKHTAQGLHTKAATLDELADKLGIDKNNLKTTVEEFNKAVRGEIKDPFRENPTKKEFMTEGPYYGVQVESAIHMTRGGVVADEKTQVLYDNGNIVSGLYAAGEVANSNSGAYSAAVIFGRIAGQEAAKYINK
ncbi:FAD-binding protein [Fusobacterium varium]|uniref:FAD-binding protein n=1 Tax=Fusobacterium varium TaxID=856 RepID=UPI001F378A47|nr:FAD-binding protein [Fusobacterium varium]MCF2672276.1 FAD-binding protein [Fusobacterium varium]